MSTTLNNTRHLELDFYRTSYKCVKIHQYDIDTRYVHVTCTNDASIFPLDPNQMTCVLKLVTPDNRHMLKEQTIQPDGTVLINIEASMTLVAGSNKAELNIYDITRSKLLSTMPFDLIVIGSVYNNDIVTATDEFDLLNDLIRESKEVYNNIKKLEEELASALIYMGTVTFDKLNEQVKKTGYLYNISNEFITTDEFKEGAGHVYPIGTNVVWTGDGYWDCLAGADDLLESMSVEDLNKLLI